MPHKPCSVVFMGTPDFAVPALAGLLAHQDLVRVVAVVTQPDRPAGRGRHLSVAPVKLCAMQHTIAVLQPTRLKEPQFAATLQSFAADVFVVAAYGRILPQSVLDIPRLTCLNIHASILPRLRGASPIAHALWHGDTETGVSIMQMAAGLDTGPVYSVRKLQIAAPDTCGTLTRRLATAGADLLLETLPAIVAQTLRAVPQDEDQASYAPLLTKQHGWLDWRTPATRLAQQVRALDPWPGTFAYVLGRDAAAPRRRVNVLQAHAVPVTAQGAPGTVLSAGPAGVVVACGIGALCLDQVKPEGRGAMTPGAWVAGRGITSADKFEVSST